MKMMIKNIFKNECEAGMDQTVALDGTEGHGIGQDDTGLNWTLWNRGVNGQKCQIVSSA